MTIENVITFFQELFAEALSSSADDDGLGSCDRVVSDFPRSTPDFGPNFGASSVAETMPETSTFLVGRYDTIGLGVGATSLD